MFALPLVVDNGFYNITKTKSVCFYIISLLTILVFALRFVVGKNKKMSVITSEQNRFILPDITFCIFAFFVVLAAALSDYPSDVWYGSNARYQGAFTLLLYLAFYFCISRNTKNTRLFVISSVITFCIVCTLGVLNCFDIDFFGFYSRLSQANKAAYISTIGNVNFYSSYLCLLFPLVLCGFCMTRHRLSQAVYCAALVVGSFGMMVTSSESFVLGFFASAAIIPLFLFKDLRQIKKYLLAFIIILCSAQAFVWIYKIVPNTNVPISGLLNQLIKPQLTILLTVVCVVLFLLLHFAPQSAKILKILYTVSLCIGLAAVLGCFALANTVGIGSLDAYFKVTEKWGSYRGEIWMQCVSLFRNFSFKEKLFGIGPECLQNISDSGTTFAGKSLDQAHNEYLQYLLTSGISGALAYIGFLFSIVWTTIRTIKNNTLAVGLLAGLIAFWIQAAVNLAQPFTTPLMFTFIAVLCGIIRSESANK